MARTDGAPRRLRREERWEQILVAATKAFAGSGFAATSLDAIAAEAGVTRVVLYRHFDSKGDLYRAVLDRMCDQVEEHVPQPARTFTEDAVDGLLAAAAESSAGFRLLFRHAVREPGFNERIDRFRDGLTEAAYAEVADVVSDPVLAGWAARAAPAAAIEATIAWLDAGQPDPGHAADRVRRVALGVFEAALPMEG
jgi:AcrR family transcriptional regulator